MLSCLNQTNIYDAANALANKFIGNFVDSSNETLLNVQFIAQASLLPNEGVNFQMDTELVENASKSVNDSFCLDVFGLS